MASVQLHRVGLDYSLQQVIVPRYSHRCFEQLLAMPSVLPHPLHEEKRLALAVV